LTISIHDYISFSEAIKQQSFGFFKPFIGFHSTAATNEVMSFSIVEIDQVAQLQVRVTHPFFRDPFFHSMFKGLD